MPQIDCLTSVFTFTCSYSEHLCPEVSGVASLVILQQHIGLGLQSKPHVFVTEPNILHVF